MGLYNSNGNSILYANKFIDRRKMWKMISGIGIDIVEIPRIKKILERQQTKFVERILTPYEKDAFDQLSENRQLEFLAGRFAAKEAFSKAAGTGIGQDLSFQDIEVRNDDKGKPIIRYKQQKGIHLSISHSSNYAVAQVIIEKE